MLLQEDAMEIAVLLKQGLGVREVARQCGVSRSTVRRVPTKARNGVTSARFGAASSMGSATTFGIGSRLRRTVGHRHPVQSVNDWTTM